jgi:hypothetical protein
VDVAFGRIACLQQSPGEGPESAPKPPFHCEREMGCSCKAPRTLTPRSVSKSEDALLRRGRRKMRQSLRACLRIFEPPRTKAQAVQINVFGGCHENARFAPAISTRRARTPKFVCGYPASGDSRAAPGASVFPDTRCGVSGTRDTKLEVVRNGQSATYANCG